jgi:hypothetical protein
LFCVQRIEFCCLVPVAEELESRSALEVEGLFRIPGSKAEIEKIKADYDNGFV